MKKLAITIGYGKEGTPKHLYSGADFDKAISFIGKPPEGVLEVVVFRNPLPWKRKDTAEGIARADAEREALQKKALEESDKRKAAAKAKADASAKAEAKAAEKAAAEKAEREQARAASEAATRAEAHQKLADENRAKAKK